MIKERLAGANDWFNFSESIFSVEIHGTWINRNAGKLRPKIDKARYERMCSKRSNDETWQRKDEKRGRRRCIWDLINLFPSLCSVLDLGILLYIRSSHCRIHRSANIVLYVYHRRTRSANLYSRNGNAIYGYFSPRLARLHPLNRLTSLGLTHGKRMVGG